jgi:hypothetical protein
MYNRNTKACIFASWPGPFSDCHIIQSTVVTPCCTVHTCELCYRMVQLLLSHIHAELILYISMFILLNLSIIYIPQIFSSQQCFATGALKTKFCTKVAWTFIIYVNTKVYIPQHNKYILNVTATWHPTFVNSWLRRYHRHSLQICNCNMFTSLNTALQNACTRT